jgi:4-hydroxy-3-methylbut-2-enyl diphosphate reductase
MVSKETIPIVLGRRKTKILVVGLLIFLGGLLTVASPAGWTTPVASTLLISLGYVAFYYWLYRQRLLGGGFLFEWVVDGSFIFAGLLAYFWSLSQKFF